MGIGRRVGRKISKTISLQLADRTFYPCTRNEGSSIDTGVVDFEILNNNFTFHERPQFYISNNVAHVGNSVAHLRQRVVGLYEKSVVNTQVEGKTERHTVNTDRRTCCFRHIVGHPMH